MLNNLNKRPEAQDAGTIILTGFEPEIVLNSVRTVAMEHKQLVARGSKLEAPKDYTITNTSWRVLKLILGNAGLSNKWWGIKTRN